jgi:hypothetical protein
MEREAIGPRPNDLRRSFLAAVNPTQISRIR